MIFIKACIFVIQQFVYNVKQLVLNMADLAFLIHVLNCALSFLQMQTTPCFSLL